ncbi:MAG TPA: hypothetical protein VMA55_10135 [Acidovorax sp.]|nr:hypothetical protein [Acidovorax sp.]
MKLETYHQGYDNKVVEIRQIGWIAARDEFNRANPPGQRWTGSADGLAYAQGEFQALSDYMGHRAIELIGIDGCNGCESCLSDEANAPKDRAKATGSA